MNLLTNFFLAIFTHSIGIAIIIWQVRLTVGRILKHHLKMKEQETRQLAIQHGINPYLYDYEELDENQYEKDETKQEQSYYAGYQPQEIPPM